MNDLYFTSDTHFGHANILSYTDRKFDNVKDMDEALIERWNYIVRPTDVIWHLGDFTFYRDPEEVAGIFHALNGHKKLVIGNHDSRKVLEPLFEEVHSLYEIKYNHQRIVMCHFPMLEWNRSHRGSWHIHGHQHGNGPTTTVPRLDIGVDCFDLFPVSFEQLAEIMSTRSWESVSHH